MQLKPLGAQRPNPNAAATFGQVRELVAVCAGDRVTSVEPLVRRIIAGLPEDVREQLGPAASLVPPPAGGVGSTALPSEATYRLFSALSGGAPFGRVMAQAQQLRAGYSALVPNELVDAALSEQQEALNNLAKSAALTGRQQQLAAQGLFGTTKAAERLRAELGKFALGAAEVRAALAEAGAVDLITESTLDACVRLFPESFRGSLLFLRVSPISNESELLSARGRSYAAQLAVDIGVPVDQAAYYAMSEEAQAAWARDPSFSSAELPRGSSGTLERTELLLAIEAKVDAELLAGPAQGAA